MNLLPAQVIGMTNNDSSYLQVIASCTWLNTALPPGSIPHYHLAQYRITTWLNTALPPGSIPHYHLAHNLIDILMSQVDLIVEKG
jgi:hypothetical protein